MNTMTSAFEPILDSLYRTLLDTTSREPRLRGRISEALAQRCMEEVLEDNPQLKALYVQDGALPKVGQLFQYRGISFTIVMGDKSEWVSIWEIQNDAPTL